MTTNKTIIRLEDIDPRSQIILRRCAGKRFSDCRSAYPTFYANAPKGLYASDDGRYFCALSLACAFDKEGAPQMPMETILGRVRASLDDTTAFDRRMDALMNAEWNDSDGTLALKLYRLCKLYCNEASPDCGALFDDLKSWTNADGRVQRKWARAIYLRNYDTDENEEEN